MKCLILGGDVRQFYMALALQRFGFEVTEYGIAKPESEIELKTAVLQSTSADIIVLPTPVSSDAKTVKMQEGGNTLLLDEVIGLISENSYVFGGMFPEKLLEQLQNRGVKCIDFMKNNCVALKNAVATAEGVIAEAIIAGKGNIHRSQCLVLGYGRCAQILAEKLKGLSAQVSVMCRNPEALSQAEAMGYTIIPMTHKACEYAQFQYIFNTIPAPVLTERTLCECNREVVIIDIASKPGGTDFRYCARNKIYAKLCGSLPGIYAPKASGDILAEAVIQVIESENN